MLLTGPVSVAARDRGRECLEGGLNAAADTSMKLADLCADGACRRLLGAYADAGASLIVIAEPKPDVRSGADAAEAQTPLAASALEHRLGRGERPRHPAPPGGSTWPAGDYDSIAFGVGTASARRRGFGPQRRSYGASARAIQAARERESAASGRRRRSTELSDGPPAAGRHDRGRTSRRPGVRYCY